MKRSLAELRFIRDRVLAEIRANPPRGPLLGERPASRPRAASCKRGHIGAGRRNDGYCIECDRERKRRCRAEATS